VSRVLVTGAQGNLGRAVVEALAPTPHTVVRSDICEDGDPGYRQADLRSLDAAKAVVTDDVDVLVHCPAWHGVHAFSRSPQDYWELNVDGTFHVLEAAAQAGIQRVVWASSAVFYGPVGFVYCFSKQVGELTLDHFRARAGMRFARMRYTAFTPPRDFLDYGLRMLDGGGLDRRDAGAATARAVDALLEDSFEDDFFDVVCGNPFDDSDRADWHVDPWAVLERRWPDHVHLLRTHLPTGLPGKLPEPTATDKMRDVLGFTPQYDFGSFVNELAERARTGDLAAPEVYSIA
jgi:nucleoside-diphosphate-sugar epimerase